MDIKTWVKKPMNQIVVILTLIFLVSVVSLVVERTETYEYKTLEIMVDDHNASRTGESAFDYTAIGGFRGRLNELGEEGWKVADTFLEMETAVMESSTRVAPNVRPQRLVIILKMRK